MGPGPVCLPHPCREVSYRSTMTSVRRPSGQHPAQVYWVRRVAVLVTVLALAFAVGRLLVGSGGDAANSATDSAAVTAAKAKHPAATTTPSPSSAPVIGPVPAGRPTAAATGTAPPVTLAEPTGPCSVDEVTVTPEVASRPAGTRVPLVLDLTGIRPACTFQVSSTSVAVKVTSGQDRIWTSQNCPIAIPSETVVVRSGTPAKIIVHWSGRRSDDTCSRSTAWALPGYYKITAAAIGSAPTDSRFQLVTPPQPVVVQTIHPKPKKQPTGSATQGPSGAATGKVG